MPGKAYTFKELKQIVDYLTEHKLYAEVKGRKMWMDFSNTRGTDRTWQSLKETFLKRILPDIHNPYYKLTTKQINSFRSGIDHEEREKNRLEIKTASSVDVKAEGGNSKAYSDKDKEGSHSGEDDQLSKIQNCNRSSTDTLVLEPIEQDNVGDEPKKLRDLITYSEPLTPMLQEVLDDFITDDEEPPLQIVENTDTVNTEVGKNKSPTPEMQSQSVLTTKAIIKDKNNGKKTENTESASQKIKSLKLKRTRKGDWENKVTDSSAPEDNSDAKNSPVKAKNLNEDKQKKTHDMSVANLIEILSGNSEKSDVTNSNITNDTPLPNNQEALDSATTDKHTNDNSVSETQLPKEKVTAKPNKKPAAKTKIDTKAKGKSVQKADNASKPESEQTVIDLDTPDNNQDISNNSIPNTNENASVSKETSAKATQNSKDKTTDQNNENVTAQNMNSVVLVTNNTSENPCLQSVSLYDEQFSTTKYTDSDSEKEKGKTTKVKNSKETAKQNSNKSNEEHKKCLEKNQQSKPATIQSKENPKDIDNNQNSKETKNNGEISSLKKATEDSNIQNDVSCISSDNNNSPGNSVEEIVVKEGDNLQIHSKPGTSRKANAQREKVLANMFGFSSGAGHLSKKKIIKRPRSRRFSYQSSKSSGHHANHSSEYSTLSEDSEFESQDCSVRHMKPYSILSHSGALCVIENHKVYPIVKRHRKGGLRYVTEWPEVEEDDDEYWKTKYLEEKIRADELAKLLNRAREREERSSSHVRSISPILPMKPTPPVESMPAQMPLPPPPVVQEVKKTEDIKDETTFKVKFAENNEIEIKCSVQTVQPVLEKLTEMFRKKEPEVPQAQLLSSGTNTPMSAVGPAERKDVDKIEAEIFKKIEELAGESSAQEENVTRRKRGRPKKDESASTASIQSAKKPKVSKETEATRKSQRSASNTSLTSKRTPRTPQKYADDKTKMQSPKKPATPRRDKNISKIQVEIPEDDSQVCYKFPDDSPETKSRSRSNTNRNASKSYDEPRLFSSPENINTSESMLGYQDSDVSVQIVKLRRRRFSSSSASSRRSTYKSKVKRRTNPYLADDDTVDITPVEAQSMNAPNSSLNTEVYRSDSYQLLMPKIKTTSRLDKIDETTAANSYTSPITVTVDNYDVIMGRSSPKTDGNSSNVSLPLSPELSIVENVTVNKELLSNAEGPTINEMQCNDVTEPAEFNKYMISDVNVSVPLMQQNCEVRENCEQQSLSAVQKSTISESMLTKIGSVNIGELSPSDSLDLKLKALLLESAKKIGDQPMEVDPNSVQKKKSRAKKRCSTPCKKAKKISKEPVVDPVLEEHVESCSLGGRKSCPPMINVIPSEPIQEAKPVKQARKKKDIIKVKITRPTKPSPKKKRARSSSRSGFTDSGINDTESGVFLHADDSIELIHNHSETCIHANECINESVEFIENKSVSIVSVDSNSAKPDKEVVREKVTNVVLAEMFCCNAQDVTNLEGKVVSQDSDGAKTVYNSPNNNSFNSLITEDLSEENSPKSIIPSISKVSKWFLVSDEEYTNSNFVDAISQDPTDKTYGANLQDIFLPCAVPNLSTITENSKDNNYSNRPSTTEK